MKFFCTFFLVVLLFQFELSGQFSDNFNDGNLNGWQGNTENFIVNPAGQLQLNAPPGSTTSWIYTPVTFTDSMVWDIYLRLDFTPSTSNQLRIYLGLTSSDLSTSTGYFLEIGATGDQDALELKYLDNGNIMSAASSVPGLVALEPVELTIRVSRDSHGIWQVFNTGGATPELLFSTQQSALPLSSLNFFGIYTKYTDTRRDKFLFDDISISSFQEDQKAPEWLSISVADHNTLKLLFDESLDPISSIDPIHYLLTPGNQMPDTIDLNGNEISLSWNHPFISQQDYGLTIDHLADPAGNVLFMDSKSFKFLEIGTAEPFDLLITEIMADPSPSIGLPEAEYLEIYNRTSTLFNMGDYKIRIGNTEKAIPDSLIYPGEFIILTDDGNSSILSSFGRVIALQNMPTLTNGGTSLALINRDGVILHEANYSLSWYDDLSKSDGGWSLEMINPSHICSGQENWKASSDLKGGTPGKINSQWNTSEDIEGPGLKSLVTLSDDVVALRFDERIDPVFMLNPTSYTFEPTLPINKIELTDPNTVQLTFSNPMEAGVIYHLNPFPVMDCLGNQSFLKDGIVFGVVSQAEPGDIRINEILFNPVSGGSRFIEIINPSQKFINLNTLSIGRINATHQDIYHVAIEEMFAPGEIAVFTPDPSDIKARYRVPNPAKLYSSTLPSWNDKSDNVAIISGGEVIDSFTYSSSWHLPAITDQNGVSLERVSITAPTFSSSNWHSASSVSGYGTPTGINSEASILTNVTEPFSILNREFSPDDDGFKDYLAIDFQLASADEIGSVGIYDLEGREIQQLLSNESLGTSALVQWDGRNMEGRIANMGIYIIFVQLWDPEGNVKQYQKSCALIKR